MLPKKFCLASLPISFSIRCSTPNSLKEKESETSIKKVLYEQNYKEKLIDLGLQRSKMFSWNKCAKETFEVYNKIAI